MEAGTDFNPLDPALDEAGVENGWMELFEGLRCFINN